MSQGPVPPSYEQPPPQKSGGSNVLLIILLVLAVIGLLCAGLCGAGFLFVRKAAVQVGSEFEKLMNAALLVETARGSIEADEAAKEKLGRPPFTTGPVTKQDMSRKNASGSGTVEFEIIGPKAKGTAHVEAEHAADKWTPTKIEIRCDDGTLLNVKILEQKPGDVILPTFDIPLDGESDEKMPAEKTPLPKSDDGDDSP